ncbi:hypothetical protein RchiOBHm_Chr4g0411801 [Rosa chinensis]|uniref:RNase H type-1 domain-containing protein n=1 Tax=Rosa chinensis TaxID=74649 RepID=A0A2P6QVR5_ROSCH|nr:hypothetical protein RchiOBHm_Chr4g0411801 [Rosa chinensis]
MAQRIWNKIMCSDSIARTWNLDWNGWLHANTHCKLRCYGGLMWVNIFIFTCWFIWKWRCKRIFDSEFRCPFDPVTVILDTVTEWGRAHTCDTRVTEKVAVTVKWTKPPPGWVKLNVDGARTQNGSIGAGGGGLLEIVMVIGYLVSLLA